MAASLAAEIKTELGLEAQLEAGSLGVYDIFFGDRLVFSKYKEGRFPTKREIVNLLKESGA